MLPSDKVIERLKKLLALSKSTNEHEAAAAAARAAELMSEHEISEATLRVTDETRTAEEITEGQVSGGKASGRAVAWKLFIADGVAAAFHIRIWRCGGKISGLGRRSAVQSWDYTCQYLYREVDRLADQGWAAADGEFLLGASARAWKNAFRVGASHAIHDRLQRQAADEQAQRAAATAAGGAGSQALVIVERDRAELDAAWELLSKHMVQRSGSLGQTSSRSGYSAGVKAGDAVHLGGGGRGLAAPNGQLR